MNRKYRQRKSCAHGKKVLWTTGEIAQLFGLVPTATPRILERLEGKSIVIHRDYDRERMIQRWIPTSCVQQLCIESGLYDLMPECALRLLGLYLPKGPEDETSTSK